MVTHHQVTISQLLIFSPAVLIFLFVRVALDAELNQAVDQVGVTQP
jgi:hypothetical protein